MSSAASHHSSGSSSSDSGIVPIGLAFLCGAAFVAALAWIFRSLQPRHSAYPQSINPPIYESPTLPLPPPKLTDETIEEFLQWVAAVPVSDAQRIRDAVALARNDDAVHSALLSELFTLPVTDFGRHQLLLSILGELRRPDSTEHLIRFVNLPGDQVIPLPPQQQGGGLCTSYLNYCAGLQARAVEMLAYLGTSRALEATLQAASAHSSLPVRLAAIDGYLFNHQDSPEAVEHVRASIRQDEAKFVGLPRRDKDSDPDEFQARVADFYKRYPAEVPPRPHATCRPRQSPSQATPYPRQPAHPQQF
jgi:hypothetical protein